MGEIIRILVVDDHQVVRSSIGFLLTSKYGMEVVGEASNGIEAVEKYQELKPDVVLMDILMPRMDGVQASIEIIRFDPAARILVLTSDNQSGWVQKAIQAGVLGFMRKDSSAQELVRSIQEVSQGNLFLPPDIARALRGAEGTLGKGKYGGALRTSASGEKGLTRREQEVLNYLVQGLTNREIATKLFTSEITARKHVSSILRKLQLKSRLQVVAYALKEGLVDQGE